MGYYTGGVVRFPNGIRTVYSNEGTPRIFTRDRFSANFWLFMDSEPAPFVMVENDHVFFWNWEAAT